MLGRFIKGAIFAICLWLGFKLIFLVNKLKVGLTCSPQSMVKASLVTLIKPTTLTETATVSLTYKTTFTDYATVTVSNCARDSPSKLSHLIIPIAFREVQLTKLIRGLRYWQSYPPCVTTSREPSTTLVFLLSEGKTIESVTRIRDIYQSLGPKVHSCFKGWDIVSANVPDHKDNHFDGSRSMFEALITDSVGLWDMHYVFWMEPDTIPIRPNWLFALQQATGGGGEEFWIKGSALRHTLNSLKVGRQYGRHFLYHINGNAIYNMARDQFPVFYQQTLLPYLERRGVAKFAFDTAIEKFLQDEANHSTWQAVAHRFHYTTIIQNRWRESLDVSAFSKSSPDTFLVHGSLPQGDAP